MQPALTVLALLALLVPTGLGLLGYLSLFALREAERGEARLLSKEAMLLSKEARLLSKLVKYLW